MVGGGFDGVGSGRSLILQGKKPARDIPAIFHNIQQNSRAILCGLVEVAVFWCLIHKLFFPYEQFIQMWKVNAMLTIKLFC